MNKMKMILIGIQGSGKSTQGNLLAKRYKIPYLSTGHIFRDIAKQKTQFGRYIKEVINSGTLVTNDIAIKTVFSYLAKPEYNWHRRRRNKDCQYSQMKQVVFLHSPKYLASEFLILF